MLNQDSLGEILLPILLSPPHERQVGNWFALQSGWRPVFGDVEQLQRFVGSLYTRSLARGDTEAACRIRNAQGRIYYSEGQYPQAVEAHQDAYQLAKSNRDSVMIGWTLTSLGSPHVLINDLETAEFYLNRGMAVGQAINNPGLIAAAKLSMGAVLGRRGRTDASVRVVGEALALSREHDLKALQEISTVALTLAHLRNEDVDEALAVLQANVPLPQGGPRITSAHHYLNFAQVYRRKGEYDQAAQYLDLACAISDSIGYGHGQLLCLESRSALAEARGQEAAALATYKAFHALGKQQAGEEAQHKIRSLHSRMELMEKDLEIAALNEANARAEATFRRRRNLLLTGVGAAILGLLGLYFGMRIRHRANTAEQRRMVAEIKLQVLQAQMNPHFIYNALSGIQNYILKSEKIEAYNYLGKFAALLRIITNYSTSVYIALNREVEFIHTYLELEKLRFRDAFDYTLTVEESLKDADRLIPSMMIQPIVENCMVHGLAGLDRAGNLNLHLRPTAVGVECTVIDNGRGRKAAAIINRHGSPGKHLSIASVNTEKRLAFLRKIGYRNARVDVTDLYEGGKPAGTQVVIYLPFIEELPTG